MTNNMAEYIGMILAEIVLALLRKDSISIRTDSQLMVKQVKGTFRVRNVRLVSIVPIVHDLIKHFTEVDISWVRRDYNTMADLYSKKAATEDVGFDTRQPDYFKITFA
jgi:ribonuclease HI